MSTRWHPLVFGAFAIVALGCGQEAPDEVETQTVVPVTTAAAEMGDVRSVIRVTGTVEPAPGADLVVTAPETARIVDMPYADGDRVRRGDVLVRFEIPSLSADLATRRGELERAEARVKNALSARTRAHDLFDKGVAARKDVEDADRELAEAEAAVREAQSGQTAAGALAARTEVRARFDGVVAKRSHNPGDVVEASSTDPVLRVIDPARLEVIAAVTLTELMHVARGSSARLTGLGDEPLPLTVVSKPAAVDPQTSTAPVRLAFRSPTTLPAGAPVQVEIDGELHKNVLTVPVAAVVREGDETAVLVVSAENKAVRTPVTLGLADAGRVEIKSGLTAGARVIVQGQNGLPDGAAVTASQDAK